MINFKPTIGIEIHTVLNTKTKMFSPSISSHSGEYNQYVNAIDLGLPGTLPQPNKRAVELGIQLATLLHMEICPYLCFDRKNYFYQDLPKGFQITQQFFPIGRNGYVEINDANGNKKKIHIERIHLEEDTAKQLNLISGLGLDYNRCGMPLIEIVSCPEIADAYEAGQYVNELKRILSFAEISDAKMEEGSLRADVNVSVALDGAKQFGTKVEIKNINSIFNITKAVDFEINRQIKEILLGNKINQETRRYDETTKSTVFMRGKSDAVDYHYFTEANIININLEDNFINNAIKGIKNDVTKVRDYLTKQAVNQAIINNLLDDFQLYQAFSFVNNQINDCNQTITWVCNELVGLIKKQNLANSILNDHDILNRMIEMIKLLKSEDINNKQAKTILEKIVASSDQVNEIIKKLGFVQIKDPKVLEPILKKMIDSNLNMLDQYQDRPERVEKFFLGLLMKETRGQANPVIANELLKELINQYVKTKN